MDRDELLNQIDFAQARIEETERLIINFNPAEKGFKELVDSYNKWIDRYNEFMTQLDNFDKEDIEVQKLNLERYKIAVQEAIDKEKMDIDRAKLAFDQDKFEHDAKQEKWKEPVDIGLKAVELGVRVAVPIIGIAGTMALASLAYTNDAELKLCNGRIFASAKEVLKLCTSRV